VEGVSEDVKKNKIKILYNKEMPYTIRKIRNEKLYSVKNTITKKIHSKATTLSKAKAQVRLLEQLENKIKKK
jgi:hypothetical protein